MSQFIKFYFTSSVLNMFRTLIHPSSGAYDFSIVSPHWLCVLVSLCVGVSLWLVVVVSVWQAEAQLVLQPATRIQLHRQEPANFFCITTLVVCSYFDMCWSFSVAGLEWYPCGRLKFQPYIKSNTHRNKNTQPMW